MDKTLVADIFDTYRKYGWIPRRLLAVNQPTSEITDITGEISIFESDIDAAWFSRQPSDGSVAWEIRYLGNTAYALLESLDENDPTFEERLSAAQTRLKVAISSKRN